MIPPVNKHMFWSEDKKANTFPFSSIATSFDRRERVAGNGYSLNINKIIDENIKIVLFANPIIIRPQVREKRPIIAIKVSQILGK